MFLSILIALWGLYILWSLFWYVKCLFLYKRFASGKEITSYIASINELFHKAGTSYTTIYDIDKGSCIFRTSRDVAYLCDEKEHFSEVNKVFLVTKGVYRARLIRSVFPIHIIFFPSYLLQRNNKSVHPVFKGILTIAYWMLDVILAYHIDTALELLYHDWLIEWLQKMF